MCVLILLHVLILLYVLILLCMCPHTPMCPHTTVYLSSYYSIRAGDAGGVSRSRGAESRDESLDASFAGGGGALEGGGGLSRSEEGAHMRSRHVGTQTLVCADEERRPCEESAPGHSLSLTHPALSLYTYIYIHIYIHTYMYMQHTEEGAGGVCNRWWWGGGALGSEDEDREAGGESGAGGGGDVGVEREEQAAGTRAPTNAQHSRGPTAQARAGAERVRSTRASRFGAATRVQATGIHGVPPSQGARHAADQAPPV
jgi:hypothetical protein